MEELTEAVTRLAGELSVPVSKIVGVVIRQAAISASVQLGGFLLLMTLYGYLCYRCYLFTPKDSDEGTSKRVSIAGLVVIGVMLLTLVMTEGPTVMAGFFNPEYWALKQFIN